MVDFGADESFANAAKKCKEHYGIDVPISSLQSIVEKHAGEIHENLQKIQKNITSKRRVDTVIGEIDGGMVPIVNFKEDLTVDRRKSRISEWMESKLSLAYSKGDITPTYGVTFDSVDAAGEQLAYVTNLVGRKDHSHVHIVGDGAPWIADQVEKHFGSQASFLIDFYHLSKYINKAAECFNKQDKDAWISMQLDRMKNNQLDEVLKDLKDHISEKYHSENNVCPAQVCYNYMIKRTKQFNYREAIEKDLPIGSGKIESGHRSVIQKRLKLSGAWWGKDNAQNMASLRVLRANGAYNEYWKLHRISDLNVH